MDTPKLALFAAASALALPALAPAAQSAPVAPARTYAQLLEPIPNAGERLKATENEHAVRAYLTQAGWHRVWRRGHWVVVWWGPHYYYRPYYRHYYYRPYYYAPPIPYLYYHHHHHHHHHHHSMM